MDENQNPFARNGELPEQKADYSATEAVEQIPAPVDSAPEPVEQLPPPFLDPALYQPPPAPAEPPLSLQEPKEKIGFGLAALILGILAMLSIGWVGLIGLLGMYQSSAGDWIWASIPIVLSIVSLIFAIISLKQIKVGSNMRPVAMAALVIGIIAVVINGYILMTSIQTQIQSNRYSYDYGYYDDVSDYDYYEDF